MALLAETSELGPGANRHRPRATKTKSGLQGRPPGNASTRNINLNLQWNKLPRRHQSSKVSRLCDCGDGCAIALRNPALHRTILKMTGKTQNRARSKTTSKLPSQPMNKTSPRNYSWLAEVSGDVRGALSPVRSFSTSTKYSV